MRVLEVYSLTKKMLASQHQWMRAVQAHYPSNLKKRQIRRYSLQIGAESVLIDPSRGLLAYKVQERRK